MYNLQELIKEFSANDIFWNDERLDEIEFAFEDPYYYLHNDPEHDIMLEERENIEIVAYFILRYEIIKKVKHPAFTIQNAWDIAINKASSFVEDEHGKFIYLKAEQYPPMIEDYFNSTFESKCNYHIIHFFSGNIRYNRYKNVFIKRKSAAYQQPKMEDKKCIPMPDYIKQMRFSNLPKLKIID